MIYHVTVADIPPHDPLWDLMRGTVPSFNQWWDNHKALKCFIYKPVDAVHGILVYRLTSTGGEIVYTQSFDSFDPKDTAALISVRLYRAYHGIVVTHVYDLLN